MIISWEKGSEDIFTLELKLILRIIFFSFLNLKMVTDVFAWR